jgi:glycosyltransferase involved in cell wall biosynthesis
MTYQHASSIQLPARTCPPGVTIAICNWNQELLLPAALESAVRACKAFEQQNVPTEILLIDHHSRDGSLTLARQLETQLYEHGLRVVALTQNHKQSFVRNQALHYAQYRHIVYLDADNELVSENLPVFYKAICQTEAAVVYGNVIWDGPSEQEIQLISNESFQLSRMFYQNYIDILVIADRMQLMDSGGFIDRGEFSGPEDWELLLHLASVGRRIVYVPVVFGIYRELSQSVARELLPDFEKNRNQLRRMYNQLDYRDQLPLNTKHLRYHPDIGYL